MARRKLPTLPPNLRPTTSKSRAATIRPIIVGITTIAMIIQTEFVNEVQKSSSVKSLNQFSRPMNSGVRTPRHLVNVR